MSTAERWTRARIYGLEQSWESLARLLDAQDGEIGQEEEAALDELVTATPQAVEQAADLVRYLENEAAELRREEVRLAERRASLEKRDRCLRDRIGKCMDLMSVKTIRGLRLTVTRLEGRERAEVENMDAVPPEFRVPQPDKPDVAAAKLALKSGQDVPGMRLVRGEPSITIR